MTEKKKPDAEKEAKECPTPQKPKQEESPSQGQWELRYGVRKRKKS